MTDDRPEGTGANFFFRRVDDGATTPIHSHAEEQMGLILEGHFERYQGGQTKLVHKGDVFYVPPHIDHGGTALDGPCRILDVFTPPRAKYVLAEEATTGQSGSARG